MTYFMTTQGNGDEETFRKVNEKVLPHADGLIAIYAGPSGDGMAIHTLWETKAHSDRFTAEVLLPALAEALGAMPDGPPSVMIECETFYDHVRVPA
jgi:hypothetical protein